MDQIRPSELSDWLARQPAGALPAVLDVREPWELQTASIGAGDGFELLHVPMSQIPQAAQHWDDERPVACLCHHGMRSMQVARFLEQLGFANVANISGGIDLWSLERDPQVPRY
ncbi:MAG: rhodanese-like domain-containing protein [Comamonas sp.]